MTSAAEKPDASLFSKDEKPGLFEAEFRVEGTCSATIRADSLEDARAKAEAMMEGDEFGLELDDVGDIYIGRVTKTPAMYRVTRDGRKTQTSYLRAGDEPREPDERGF